MYGNNGILVDKFCIVIKAYKHDIKKIHNTDNKLAIRFWLYNSSLSASSSSRTFGSKPWSLRSWLHSSRLDVCKGCFSIS
jgi:hypothetical protein